MTGGIKGIVTALITPFTEDDRLDEKGLSVTLHRQVDNGVHGIAVVAASGEFVNLPDDERSRVVEISVREVSGRIPVLVGVFSANTRDASNWAKKAAGLGADALLVLTPVYNRPSTEGLIYHVCSAWIAV
jgi:4-hydroxy-tetrahydrodipicolinate synthase